MSGQFKVINFLRVPLTVLVVALHAYTATRTVSWLHDGYPIYKFVMHNLALLSGYIPVPFFFFISGFLFFYSSSGTIVYNEKWKRRLHTLFIPYILWNFLVIILFYIVQTSSIGESFLSGEHKLVVSFSWYDFLRAFWDMGQGGTSGFPILSVYWYIRNLMILSLLAPVIRYFNLWFKYVWLIPFLLHWLFTPNLALTSCSIFWFGAGTYFAYRKVDWNVFCKYWKTETTCFFFFFITYNVIFFFKVDIVFAVFVNRMCVLCAIPVVYILISKGISKWHWEMPSLFNKACFFVFSCHFFIIIAIRKLSIKLFPHVCDMGAV